MSLDLLIVQGESRQTMRCENDRRVSYPREPLAGQVPECGGLASAYSARAGLLSKELYGLACLPVELRSAGESDRSTQRFLHACMRSGHSESLSPLGSHVA